jgi:hypothetical protein
VPTAQPICAYLYLLNHHLFGSFCADPFIAHSPPPPPAELGKPEKPWPLQQWQLHKILDSDMPRALYRPMAARYSLLKNPKDGSVFKYFNVKFCASNIFYTTLFKSNAEIVLNVSKPGPLFT